MTSEIVQWFKTSIPGIIILGALGSILALVLLKVIKRAVPHLSGFLLNRFLFPFFKFVMAEELVAVRLMKAGDQTKLLIYCVWIIAMLLMSTVLLLISLAVTTLYFVVSSRHLTFGAFLLVTLSFLSLLNWVGDACTAVAVYDVTLHGEYKEQVRTLKKYNRVEFFRALRAELPQRAASQLLESDSSPSGKKSS